MGFSAGVVTMMVVAATMSLVSAAYVVRVLREIAAPDSKVEITGGAIIALLLTGVNSVIDLYLFVYLLTTGA